MSFRLPLVALFLSPLFVAVSAANAANANAPRPNILLVCVDDLKPVLGCYGDTLAKTPHIDRLAATGTVFERAYCNQAVCSPSRNALMTGLRPSTTGIYDLGTNFRLASPDAVTVAQYFKEHGWRTEALGKIFHTGHGNREDAASWSVPHWRPRGGSYATAAGSQRSPGAAADARGAPVENADVPDNAYADGMIADEAIARLRTAREQRDTPFFLAVGFLKPHLPFCAPKKYWDLHDRSRFEPHALTTAPAGAPDYASTSWGELRKYAGMPEKGPLTAAQQRELIHGYYAAVSFMDAQLGRILDELERLRLADDTVVVFWGDHGWHLGDHGQWCKHTNYEQATRIPVIVRAPAAGRPGTRARGLVESVDIYPTLAELAGLPAPTRPRPLDGQSFAALLRDPAAKSKPAVFHAYPRSRPGTGSIIGRAVRTERHRLVEWKKPGAAPDSAELELYDYVADPHETKNLAHDQPAEVTRLRALLATQPEARPQLRPLGRNAGPKRKTATPAK